MKNKKIISLMLAALSSFSSSMAAKKNVKSISKKGGANVIRRFGSDRSILSGNRIKKARRKNKGKYSELKRHAVNGVLTSNTKYNSKDKNASGSGRYPNFKDYAKDASVVFLQGDSKKMSKKSKVIITPLTFMALFVGICILNKTLNTSKKSEPGEGSELDEIKFTNRADKEKYIEMLNYLQDNIELKCYEYQGKKYLFLEWDLKNGSTVCASGCYLIKKNRRLTYSSFLVNNDEVGQVEKYFKYISDEGVVPVFGNIEQPFNKIEINSMVSSILCFVKDRVGNINSGLAKSFSGKMWNCLQKELSDIFFDRLRSAGVSESLSMSCFSAHSLDSESRIVCKTSNKIEIEKTDVIISKVKIIVQG